MNNNKPYVILVILSLLSLFIVLMNNKKANGTPLKPTPVKIEKVVEVDTVKPIDESVEALIFVESRGKEDAVGDTHLGAPSIGVLQIRPIMVREVNRILKQKKSDKKFKLKDRFSRDKSIKMFMVWKNFHHPNDGFEKIARNWNGGPNGYRFKRTEYYWSKVRKQLEL